MNHNVTVTENVYKRISFLGKKANNQNLKLRIEVSGGGCSGFSYNYSMTEKAQPSDIEISNGELSVLIDKDSMEFLNSCKIDFIEELGNSYFSITNPNATAKCGCGNSFAV